MGQSVIEHRAAGSGSLNLAILTVSDTRTLETDASGTLIVALATEAGHRVVSREIVPDEPAQMTALIRRFAWPRRSPCCSSHGRNRDQPARSDV